MKKVILVLFILILSVGMIACSADGEEAPGSEEPTESIDISEADLSEMEFESIISEEETIYTKIEEDGTKVYLAEESPEIVLLKMKINEYNNLAYNIDYETATGDEYFPVLTEEAKAGEEENDLPQQWVDFYNEHKIKRVAMGIEGYEFIEIDGDEARLKVHTSFMNEQVEDLNNTEEGVVYHLPQELIFKNIDSEWYLSEVVDVEAAYRYTDED